MDDDDDRNDEGIDECDEKKIDEEEKEEEERETEGVELLNRCCTDGVKEEAETLTKEEERRHRLTIGSRAGKVRGNVTSLEKVILLEEQAIKSLASQSDGNRH